MPIPTVRLSTLKDLIEKRIFGTSIPYPTRVFLLSAKRTYIL